jgi:hypothetical protein
MIETLPIPTLALLAASFVLIPPGIAFYRGHHQRWAILALSVLFGWTLIGWALALIWASTAVRTPVSSAD